MVLYGDLVDSGPVKEDTPFVCTIIRDVLKRVCTRYEDQGRGTCTQDGHMVPLIPENKTPVLAHQKRQELLERQQ